MHPAVEQGIWREVSVLRQLRRETKQWCADVQTPGHRPAAVPRETVHNNPEVFADD